MNQITAQNDQAYFGIKDQQIKFIVERKHSIVLTFNKKSHISLLMRHYEKMLKTQFFITVFLNLFLFAAPFLGSRQI